MRSRIWLRRQNQESFPNSADRVWTICLAYDMMDKNSPAGFLAMAALQPSVRLSPSLLTPYFVPHGTFFLQKIF